MSIKSLLLTFTFLIPSVPALGQASINASMTTAQIQTALNGGTGANFAAGTYTETASLSFPCNAGQVYSGPNVGIVTISNQPTAIIEENATGRYAFSVNSNVSTNTNYTSGCTFKYFEFRGQEGAIYVNYPQSGITLQNNYITLNDGTAGICDGPGGSGDCSKTQNGNAIPSFYLNGYFNPSTGGCDSNCNAANGVSYIMIDSNVAYNNCATVRAQYYPDSGGVCDFLWTQSYNNHELITNNVVNLIEEGFKWNEILYTDDDVTNNLDMENNQCSGNSRVCFENQQNTNGACTVSHNAFFNPGGNINPPGYNTFEVSFPANNASPTCTLNDNVIAAGAYTEPGSSSGNQYGVGFEVGGAGMNGQYNAFFNGNYSSHTCSGNCEGWNVTMFSNNPGQSWTNNYFSGTDTWNGTANDVTKAFSVEDGATKANATLTPNTVVQTSINVQVSAPVITAGTSNVSIASGDTQHNLSIFYTTDGTTPVPFPRGGSAGTSQFYTAPFTPANGSTIKAIASWGQAGNQGLVFPTTSICTTASTCNSGPNGSSPYTLFGYIPSTVASATFTGGGGGTVAFGNSSDNTAGGTYPNYFNDVYAVTGINAAGYTVNTGTVCIAPGTVTNGKNIDIGVSSAPTATTEGTTALCHATYTNISNTSPGCVTVPLNGCGLLSSNKAYWLWTITNDPLGPSPLYFSNCGGTCNGAAPTSSGVGTYGGFYLAGTYGSYAAMSSTFTGQNTAQPSVYLGVTPAVEYGVTTTSVNDATSANYFNDVYAVTGSSSGGYTVNAGTVCIAPGTVTQGKQTDIGINTAPTATTEGATALCHATYTNTSSTSPGCVTVPLTGCGTLSPNTPYWLWTITNDPIQGSPLYFSNCGGTCNGSAPTSAGVGTYGGFYLHGTYGTYTGMSSAFTGGPSPGQPSVSLSVTPH